MNEDRVVEEARLKAIKRCGGLPRPHQTKPEQTDKSDMLERFRIENTRLQAENEKLAATMKLHAGDCCSLNNEAMMFKEHWDAAEEENTRLQAENKNLREEKSKGLKLYYSAVAKIDRLKTENKDLTDKLQNSRAVSWAWQDEAFKLRVKPEPTEFTKKCRKGISLYLHNNNDDPPFVGRLLKACEIIDHLSAKVKLLFAHVSVYAPVNPMLTGLKVRDDEIDRLKAIPQTYITRIAELEQDNLDFQAELKTKDDLLKEAMPALYKTYHSDDLGPGSLPCRIEQALKGSE